MLRRTKSPKIALERIRELVSVDVGNRTTIRSLAFYADIAKRMKRPDIPGIVRWTGRVPTRGVKGWEAEALEWLLVEL